MAKQILDKYATLIIRKNAIYTKNGIYGIAQSKSEHYKPEKYSEDIVLWIPPKNCIRLEFEDTPENNKRYITEIESSLKSLGMEYCITYHDGGKSPYINIFNIKGIPLNDDNKLAKELLIDLIATKEAKKTLDKTNLGWTLSPVIGHEHWKPKYNGAIHKIVIGKNPLEQENTYPKELLRKIEKAKKEIEIITKKWKYNDSWVENFLIDYCCNNELPKGQRHTVIEKNLAALIIFRPDKEVIKQKWRESQQTTTDSMKTWEVSILNGNFTEVSAGELAKYIKENQIPFEIPRKPTELLEQTNKNDLHVEQRYLLKLDNYLENVQQYHTINPFFYDKAGLFWFWNENKWERVDETDIMNDIEKRLGFYGATIKSSIKSNYLEAFKRVGRMNLPTEAPKHWIQFNKTIYDIKNKISFPASHKYFLTNPIPWIVRKGEINIIDKLITEWVGKENKDIAYEIIAYCCLMDYPLHHIFCFIGSGRNGKSKYLGMLQRFIGAENISSTELDTLLDSRFESVKLYKKLVCQLGETNFGILNKTSLLKRLCGQDLIGFEFKGKQPFDDYNYAKILIASNSLPSSEDTSDGFYRRWIILDFPNKFEEGKDVLELIPAEEYNYLAYKCLEILPKLLTTGKFTNQGSIEERKEKYLLASNPLSFFIRYACTEEIGGFMRYSDLYTKYCQFLKVIDRRIVSRKEFNKILDTEGFEVHRTTKRIGDRYENGTFVENLVLSSDFMQFMQFMQQFPLNSLYKGTELKILHNLHKMHKNDKTDKNVPEIHHKCYYCKATPCQEYGSDGHPYCSDCYESRKVNGQETPEEEVE